MPDLNNSSAQFIITASIGLLAVLAAIFIPLFIYRRQRSQKEITWRIISNTLVLPVVDVGEQVKGKLQISFEGKPVNDLRLVVLKLSNTGNTSIETSDFEDAMPIVV